jgi:hypothetical protein
VLVVDVASNVKKDGKMATPEKYVVINLAVMPEESDLLAKAERKYRKELKLVRLPR